MVRDVIETTNVIISGTDFRHKKVKLITSVRTDMKPNGILYILMGLNENKHVM